MLKQIITSLSVLILAATTACAPLHVRSYVFPPEGVAIDAKKFSEGTDNKDLKMFLPIIQETAGAPYLTRFESVKVLPESAIEKLCSPTAAGCFSRDDNIIYLSDSSSRLKKVVTLIHEYGHSLDPAFYSEKKLLSLYNNSPTELMFTASFEFSADLFVQAVLERIKEKYSSELADTLQVFTNTFTLAHIPQYTSLFDLEAQITANLEKPKTRYELANNIIAVLMLSGEFSSAKEIYEYAKNSANSSLQEKFDRIVYEKNIPMKDVPFLIKTELVSSKPSLQEIVSNPQKYQTESSGLSIRSIVKKMHSKRSAKELQGIPDDLVKKKIIVYAEVSKFNNALENIYLLSRTKGADEFSIAAKVGANVQFTVMQNIPETTANHARYWYQFELPSGMEKSNKKGRFPVTLVMEEVVDGTASLSYTQMFVDRKTLLPYKALLKDLQQL